MFNNDFSEGHALLLKMALQCDQTFLNFFSLKLVLYLFVDKLADHADLEFLISHFLL